MKTDRIAKVVVPQPVNITTGLELEKKLMDAVMAGTSDKGYLLWRSRRALVVPRSATHKPGFAAAKDYCDSKEWPVITRSTGGELTPQDPGFINLSMVVKLDKGQLSIKGSYELICDAMSRWLSKYGIKSTYGSIDGAFCDGDYNLVVDGKKIAGTAQRWQRIRNPDALAQGGDTALLIHAVILCDGPLQQMWQICNEFYEKCELPPFIRDECHLTLSQLMGQNGEYFVQKVMNDLADEMSRYIDQLNFVNAERVVEKRA
ncbi:lipoate--protein ligase family protein [Pontibacter sp. JAM-7]|uniref:lipoate--protein ligase family protein n=1 Tax=Pontibacter sp. JAM-7 TaxID=3366581 RepID=UPI003AF793A6